MANYVLVIVALLGIVHTGYSLRCWQCSSDMDAPCADHFNTTAFRMYFRPQYQTQSTPQLMECNTDPNGFGHMGLSQRAVCMKKVQTTYGRTTYIRSCRFIHPQEPVGYCPEETTGSSTTIEHCSYCDYDGCNGANTVSKSVLAIIIPGLLLGLLLKK